MYHLLLLASVASPIFEDLEILDDRIIAVSEFAEPIDKRLKLAECPDDPIIAPPVGGSVVVRCPALGWRLRVPVKTPLASVERAEIIIRKGEMVAGLLILFVNIFGGLILGIVSHDLSFGEAAQTYIRARLEQEYMRTPTQAEMADATGLEAAAYHAMAASTQPAGQESIDESYSDHDMWFADLADGADTALEKAQLRDALVANLAKLSEREALILQLYFAEELNLDEIGETLGVGAARVCQIKKAALEKMRVMMAD